MADGRMFDCSWALETIRPRIGIGCLPISVNSVAANADTLHESRAVQTDGAALV
jgi:hypothetical protein